MTTEHAIERADDLGDWLQQRPGPVRVVGTGTRQDERPQPPTDATRLDLSRLRAIVRLDAGDQTCTVETGVPRTELDDELARHDLELPCLGDGTIGGLFAADPHGAGAVPGQSPRSLLLGIEANLASGQPFKSGARVVKSVAGFDVHKLFVGSHGRLFVVRRLHLRLKPKPRACEWFANPGLELEPALQLLQALRMEALPPDVLQLRRDRDGTHAVLGRVAGRAVHVRSMLSRHGLQVAERPDSVQLGNRQHEELLRGAVLPSALARLLAELPAAAPFAWLGGGRFETSLPDRIATDTLLARLPELGVAATVARGTDDRLATSTPDDDSAASLADELKRALDPDGILV